jgi:hypothetical protein
MMKAGVVRFCQSLVIRKECWKLSWRGRLLFALVVLLPILLMLLELHPFLAVTHRVNSKVLVVEGWIHEFGIDAAVNEFKTGHYERVLTTGGPVEGIGTSSSIYDTEAWQSAELLVKAGIPAEDVQSVPSRFVGRDRTFNSAITLRNWFRAYNVSVGKINILTEDAHARRTWLLFQEALGPGVEVGIISAPNPDYDAIHWWRSSEGVREVIGEGIAYIYAKFLFWPEKAKTESRNDSRTAFIFGNAVQPRISTMDTDASTCTKPAARPRGLAKRAVQNSFLSVVQ